MLSQAPEAEQGLNVTIRVSTYYRVASDGN
jgi:hypothetical protein